MKKIILLAAMMLSLAVAASAQPRAIGARLGWGIDFSYQHTVKDADFVEANLGLNNFNSLDLSAVYNFMIAQPQWTDRGEWGFYAGPGATVGFGIGNEKNFFNLSAAGMVGLEYTFWFPLQLSIDFRQHLGLGFGGIGFYNLSSICLGIRYRF